MDANCDNSFSDRIILSHNQSLILAIINTVMMLPTAIANIVIIVGLIKTKQLDSKVNRMFIGLSISDVCISVIVQPMATILFTFEKQRRNCRLELATQFLTLLFCHCSAFLIVVIAIERLVHVREMRVRNNQIAASYKRIHATMVCCFVMSLFIAVLVTLASLNNNYLIASVALKLVDFLAIMMIYTAYIETFRAVYRHVQSTQFLRNGNSTPAYATSMLKAIMLIIFFLFVCYMPYLCIGLLVFNDKVLGTKTSSSTNTFLNYFSGELVYLNSFFNAVVVLNKNRYLLKYFVDLFSRKRRPITPLRFNSNRCAPITLNDIEARIQSEQNRELNS